MSNLEVKRNCVQRCNCFSIPLLWIELLVLSFYLISLETQKLLSLLQGSQPLNTLLMVFTRLVTTHEFPKILTILIWVTSIEFKLINYSRRKHKAVSKQTASTRARKTLTRTMTQKYVAVPPSPRSHFIPVHLTSTLLHPQCQSNTRHRTNVLSPTASPTPRRNRTNPRARQQSRS